MRPRRSRSIPAQAIIAPLSVQSFGGGATSGRPASRAKARQRLRERRIGGDAAGDHERLARGADALRGRA